MIKIAPSILSANFGSLADATLKLSEAGADLIHIDVMDGHFVPNITFGAQVVRALRPVTNTPFDTHLMVEQPERLVEEFCKAGSNCVTVHPEATRHLDRVLNQIRECGVQAGVALNPATPIEQIEWVLRLVDRVLVMTVNPGFGGQVFIAEMTRKIMRLANIRDELGLSFEIGVDGGIDKETVVDVARAGASVVVSGTSVFKHPGGFAQAIAEIRSAASSF